MANVLQSASKIVLIVIALTVSAGFLLRILTAEDFKIFGIMVFVYYFSYTPINPQPTDTPPTVLK